MERNGLLKRAADLYKRSEDSGIITSSGFLTPAEQLELTKWADHMGCSSLYLYGGQEESERKAAFFLPFYIEKEDFKAEEHISAIVVASKFSDLDHRDFLGAILGLGIKRECVGDILIFSERAYFFCLPSVSEFIILNLIKVGRFGVKAERTPISAVPEPDIKKIETSFTVKSMRLDAVSAGMFSMSRTSMSELIGAGQVSLNYEVNLKADAPVSDGDIISVRGRGKGKIFSDGGVSRKGRLFVKAEILK